MVLLTVTLLFASCNWPSAKSSDCCIDVSVVRTLDEQTIPDDELAGRVSVELRFDKKAIVATVADRNQKIAYLSTEDGGITWHHDQFYQDLRSWQTHMMRDGEILPWNPNPADQAVRYRTVHFSEGKSYNERSTDSGKSWTRMKEHLLGYDSKLETGGPIFYHPRDPLTFFVAGNLPGWQYGWGMFITVDGGDTFRFMYITSLINSLAVSQSNPEILYGAGKFGSVLKSTDGGKFWDLVGQNDLIRKTRTWKSVEGKKDTGRSFNEWPTDIDGIAIDPIDVNRVYLATSKGLLCSENGGETWCVLETGIAMAHAIHSIVIVPGQPNVLLIGTYKGLLRSTDSGCHWESIDVLSRVVD